MRKLIFTLLLLGASIAQAGTVHLDPTCTNNGDGTTASCASGAGGEGAYNSFANFVTGEAGVLSEDLTVKVQAGADASSSTRNFTGFTTGSYRITLEPYEASDWHDGSPDSGYRLQTSGYSSHFQINKDNITLRGIVLDRTATGGVMAQNLVISEGGAIIDGCIFDTAATSHDGGWNMINIGGLSSGDTIHFRNNVVLNAVYNGVSFGSDGGETIYLENNTVIDAANNGFNCSYESGYPTNVYVRNNIAQGSGGNDFDLNGYAGAMTDSNNLAEDTTGDIQSTLTFEDVSSDDYHLAVGDTDAIDAGTSLSSTFTTDFDDHTRSGTWDVGVDEYNTSATTTTTSTTTTTTSTTTSVTTTSTVNPHTEVGNEIEADCDTTAGNPSGAIEIDCATDGGFKLNENYCKWLYRRD